MDFFANREVALCRLLPMSNRNLYCLLSTSAGFGLFCKIDSAAITDLIVQDYNFTSMPNTAALDQYWGNYQGGLVGITFGNSNILNCHLQGTNIYIRRIFWICGCCINSTCCPYYRISIDIFYWSELRLAIAIF